MGHDILFLSSGGGVYQFPKGVCTGGRGTFVSKQGGRSIPISKGCVYGRGEFFLSRGGGVYQFPKGVCTGGGGGGIGPPLIIFLSLRAALKIIFIRGSGPLNFPGVEFQGGASPQALPQGRIRGRAWGVRPPPLSLGQGGGRPPLGDEMKGK